MFLSCHVFELLTNVHCVYYLPDVYGHLQFFCSRKLCTRATTVSTNLLYELENYGNCLPRAETKLSNRSLHYRYGLLQKSIRYKSVNVAEDEQ
jgi:hypothetical protein